MPKSNAYLIKKKREAARQAEKARTGADISEDFPKLPAARKRKRDRYAKSLLQFCKEPLAEMFPLKFSDDHLKAIKKMEHAILNGGNFALAMPRGSGKTTLILAACLWAILHGHKRFLALIAADKEEAETLMQDIIVELETNDDLYDLYPEACHPFRALERIANRCKGQNWKGSPTYIQYKASKIVFASIPNSPVSGAIIKCVGITGKVRGMAHKTPDGERIRPDIFVVDDPQTDKTAASESMVAQRLKIITQACVGLAGPKNEISGFCLCTVIEPDDVADQLLDTDLYPDWAGERFQMVYKWPTGKCEQLWEQYVEILRESLAAGEGYEAATKFYKANRKAMDRGIQVAWKERYTETAISAEQGVYNLLVKLKDGFWRECQNNAAKDDDDEDLLSVTQIQAKTNGFKRGEIPPHANLVTGFVDIQDRALYWLVLAVCKEDFSCWVVDYATFPKQRSKYFTLGKLTQTLQKQYPRKGREARIRQGILDLTNELISERDWRLPNGTTQLRFNRCGLDAAWEGRVVQAAALESPHSAVLLPRFGRGIGADDAPFEAWRPKPGETRGVGWKIRPGEAGGVYGLIDTNYWKNFAHARLQVETGDPGSLSLFKPESSNTHRMLAEHCRAERRVESKNNQRRVMIYKERPSKPDNHLWDCLVGALAMAGVEGAQLGELRVARKKKTKRRKRRPTYTLGK